MSKVDRRRRTLERTAYHEAGHAVVALELHQPFCYVTIIPAEDSLGHVMRVPRPESIQPDNNGDLRMSEEIEREVMVGLAGVIAEAELTGRHNYVGASSDFKGVFDLVSNLYWEVTHYDEVLSKWLDYMLARTRAFVRYPWRWVQIEALAGELLIHKRLSEERVEEICRAAKLDRKRVVELNRADLARDAARRSDKLARCHLAREKRKAKAKKKAEAKGIGSDGTPG